MWSAGRGTDVWALFQACAAGDLAAVQALIAKDRSLARAHYAYRKPLYFAVRENHVDVARFLLERGAFPNPPIESSGDALWVSREWRQRATPSQKEPDEDWPSRAHDWLRISSLHHAARKGDLEDAKRLLDSGADLTARDEHFCSTPPAWAAKYGQIEMVKFLLERGAPKTLPEDPP
ncbi:MAG TPA: ankyrin repeat domain-containing protein [Vicinamibacterales bacterium]|jgi:ankyrin repeat protein